MINKGAKKLPFMEHAILLILRLAFFVIVPCHLVILHFNFCTFVLLQKCEKQFGNTQKPQRLRKQTFQADGFSFNGPSKMSLDKH